MRRATALLFCLLLFAATIWASPDATQIGQATGAPGEGTCEDCHGHLNDGPGSVSFTGLGGAYNLGQLFEMGVSIEHIGQGRWGFMVTALDGTNQPAGTFLINDAPRTRLLANSGRFYVAHTAAGTDPGVTHQNHWDFRWTAPSEDVGPVTFYLVAMAANNDGGTGGDYSYSETYTFGYSSVLGDAETGPPAVFATAQNYPNPFNAGTVISIDLPDAAQTRVDIFDILGRRNLTLVNEFLEPGTHEFSWDGMVENGTQAPSGIYFYRIRTPASTLTRKMVLLR